MIICDNCNARVTKKTFCCATCRVQYHRREATPQKVTKPAVLRQRNKVASKDSIPHGGNALLRKRNTMEIDDYV